MQNKLYVASKSSSRKMLLDQAHLQYTIIGQDADETKCDWGLTLHKVVENIAQYKMDHAILPVVPEGTIIFVLTADTLNEDTHGNLSGKPLDYADAFKKLKAARGKNRCGTAFCLDKKQYAGGQWTTLERVVKYVEAQYEFDMPDAWIEKYCAITHALDAAGAIKIEEYGAQFVKEVIGSNTAIIGLPMYELRIALQELGFFEN